MNLNDLNIEYRIYVEFSDLKNVAIPKHSTPGVFFKFSASLQLAKVSRDIYRIIFQRESIWKWRRRVSAECEQSSFLATVFISDVIPNLIVLRGSESGQLFEDSKIAKKSAETAPNLYKLK